jgi:hypothetical protein
MYTLKNSKGKKAGIVSEAPYLEDIMAESIMDHVENFDDYKRGVISLNDSEDDKTKKITLRNFLDRISKDVKAKILKDTLPTKFPSLQDLYPSNRKFFNPPGGS